MSLLDIFRKKPSEKCAECFRPIHGDIRTLDNKKYCNECYNRRITIIQQTGSHSPSALGQAASAPTKETFVCDICKTERPTKYRHNGNTCADCAELGHKPISPQSYTDLICIGSQHISGSNMRILCQTAYSPSARMVVCTTTSTADTTPRYETLAVPDEINTADGLIAFIQSQCGAYLVCGYQLSDDLRKQLDAAFLNAENDKCSDTSVPEEDVLANEELQKLTAYDIDLQPEYATKPFLVTPVAQQHYWQCSVAAELKDGEWRIRITDTYAIDRYNDQDSSATFPLPAIFPYMLTTKLRDFLNQKAALGPGGGRRQIKPGELSQLIHDAVVIQRKRTPEKQICTDSVRRFNNGCMDFACQLTHPCEDRYFYFKEAGNNKGHCMGYTVYQIDREQYMQYQADQLDRNTLAKKIIVLPPGDWLWDKDQFLMQLLLDRSEGQ